MGFSRQLTFALTRYLLRQRLVGRTRFPLVLMLEPTHRCNLACGGCGRIREYQDSLQAMLSVAECLAAVEEAGAPVVAVTGGEPLLHPEIEQIVDGTIAQQRFVYLCTNGLLLERSLEKFGPSPQFAFNVHLDGLTETHDAMAGRQGVFEAALRGIRAAKGAGFQVCTNTTVYKGSEPDEVAQLLHLLVGARVDGILVSPAFSYREIGPELFFSREEVHGFFRALEARSDGIRFYNTPLYLAFLRGEKELECLPWGNPTRNPQGWKRPCYLITDGHCASFRELMEETDWERYGVGKDPRCANCMVHSGFEASAVVETGRSFSNLWRVARWALFA